MKTFIVSSIGLVLLMMPAQASALKSGNHRVSIDTAGMSREYVVHVPKGYDGGKPLPLVIVLHGGLGNQTTARWDTRMSRKADKDKFFAVYPQGTGRTWTHLLTWNAGDCCGLASTRKVDDVGFIRGIISKMQKDFNIDPRLICVAGISNGGMMAYRCGRELSDVVAAIAPVSGSMRDVTGTSKSPVSVIIFHGTDDNIIPYNGGDGSVFGYKFHSLPVSDAIDFWTRSDQCASNPVTEDLGPLLKQRYIGGANGTEVCVYTIKNGSHSWPGGRAAWPIWSKPTHAISATDAICEFFWSHPKQVTAN